MERDDRVPYLALDERCESGFAIAALQPRTGDLIFGHPFCYLRCMVAVQPPHLVHSPPQPPCTFGCGGGAGYLL